jgi:PKD repeat protein
MFPIGCKAVEAPGDSEWKETAGYLGPGESKRLDLTLWGTGAKFPIYLNAWDGLYWALMDLAVRLATGSAMPWPFPSQDDMLNFFAKCDLDISLEALENQATQTVDLLLKYTSVANWTSQLWKFAKAASLGNWVRFVQCSSLIISTLAHICSNADTGCMIYDFLCSSMVTATIAPGAPTIGPGESVQLRASLLAADGEALSIDPGHPWKWSCIDESALVSGTGLFTAPADLAGWFTVSARISHFAPTGVVETLEAEAVVTVTPQDCSYDLPSPSSKSFSADAGSGSFSVTTQTGCTWTAASDSSWVTLTATGSPGSGTVNYTVGANNTGSPRTGHISVKDKTFTISQEAKASVCTYGLSPDNRSFTADASSGSFSVTTQTGCTWTAASDSSWVTLTATGSPGSGTVNYTVGANNTGSPRTGHISVKDKTFTIAQAAAQPNQAPTCSLYANPTSGPAPLAVTFTLSASDSDGSISSWVLDANGDGTMDFSGSGTPPSTKNYTYNSAGSYIALLLVTDNRGATAASTATVNAGSSYIPPTCTLSANPSSGSAPLSVTFTMTANAPSGTITAWALDPGDGSGPQAHSGTGSPPSTVTHTYTAANNYNAMLMVGDGHSNATASRTISVAQPTPVNVPPTCSLYANPTSGPAPLAVTFTLSASDSDGSISSWVLDANGDGTMDFSGSGTPPSTKNYTYNSAGSYIALLLVTDNRGATAASTATVNAGSSYIPPTCTLSANPSSGSAPLSVTFTMTANAPSGTITAWALDPGDGSGPQAHSGTGSPPSTVTHTYTAANNYNAMLMVGDGHSNATASRTISVNSPAPTLAFTLSPPTITTSSSTYRATLQLTGSNFLNVNQVSYSWTGAGSGSATWNKGDLSWNSAVVVGSDGSMTLSPVVLSNVTSSQSKTWTWTVTLRDNTGATASRPFTVTYNP